MLRRQRPGDRPPRWPSRLAGACRLDRNPRRRCRLVAHPVLHHSGMVERVAAVQERRHGTLPIEHRKTTFLWAAASKPSAKRYRCSGLWTNKPPRRAGFRQKHRDMARCLGQPRRGRPSPLWAAGILWAKPRHGGCSRRRASSPVPPCLVDQAFTASHARRGRCSHHLLALPRPPGRVPRRREWPGTRRSVAHPAALPHPWRGWL